MKELIIELSHNCNLACIMCGFGGKPASPKRFITWQTLNLILDQVPSVPERVRLNGRGESTIHPAFIPMMEHVQSRYPQSIINLFSNLMVTNKDLVYSLAEKEVQLFISMDSPNALELESIRRGARFSILEKNIKRLAIMKRRPHVVFTIQEANLHRMVDMARYCIDRNMHIIFNTIRRDEGIEPFIEMVQNKREELAEAYRLIHALYDGTELNCLLPNSIQGIIIQENGTNQTFGGKKECPALREELCILHNGAVTPCNMFNPYEYGNILQERLGVILESEKRRWFLENNKAHSYCANCACMGGTA
ncbi:MAG: SPASM domain-containing protein [Pseudodesulfovibrio sp.]|nr:MULTISPECIES: SPASM domain-containing protein [Pseudodesulfovibrio]MBU4380579.1 SPASM domain-containing protein [Pseudomonadota bacterium]MBU4474824.1 SPASM domain-containing protein [Pseudomonadota bacterium]MBU4516306.1 SPASM domain-containing protein [Pseudomonadota bacterium]MBU4522487.1 SPASM domain-containing protein [Pseudomonadota bacterium]MBU4558687.1 SPASM domain-containing protein [Pseudomonadota bacterium]